MLYNIKIVYIFAKRSKDMEFDDITGDGRIWAVRYDGDDENILTILFRKWNDIDWLSDFFIRNRLDLESFFHITDFRIAVYDTLRDASELESIILDFDSNTDYERFFRPLENSRISEMCLGREKAKGKRIRRHDSWLRVYALKFEINSYLITGGSIKLTRTMQEREHTDLELRRLNMVRDHLIGMGVTNLDGFNDLITE